MDKEGVVTVSLVFLRVLSMIKTASFTRLHINQGSNRTQDIEHWKFVLTFHIGPG